MRFSTAFVAAFAAVSSVSAVTLQTPSGWTSTGPDAISFTTVSTDPSSFAVLLINQGNTSLLPNGGLLLSSNISSSNTSFSYTPPCASPLPVASGYQVYIIKNSTQLTASLAQSETFNITKGTTTCSTSTSAGASSTGGTASPTGASASASATHASAANHLTVSNAFSALVVVGGIVALFA